MAIVLSYHGNTESEAALRQALEMARQRDTSLVIVLARRSSQEDARTVADVEERLWATLGRTEVGFEIRHMPEGQEIADAVLETAASVDADAIVLGLRPGGSRATTVGRNASRILLDAECPVTTTTDRTRD